MILHSLKISFFLLINYFLFNKNQLCTSTLLWHSVSSLLRNAQIQSPSNLRKLRTTSKWITSTELSMKSLIMTTLNQSVSVDAWDPSKDSMRPPKWFKMISPSTVETSMVITLINILITTLWPSICPQLKESGTENGHSCQVLSSQIPSLMSVQLLTDNTLGFWNYNVLKSSEKLLSLELTSTLPSKSTPTSKPRKLRGTNTPWINSFTQLTETNSLSLIKKVAFTTTLLNHGIQNSPTWKKISSSKNLWVVVHNKTSNLNSFNDYIQ